MEDETGRASNAHGRDEKLIQNCTQIHERSRIGEPHWQIILK